MIPKKIHYIWIGEKPKSKLSEICINSWYRSLPDYEIIEWNEKNLPIESLRRNNKFFDQCFKLKLWAFVSDYLRLYILYNQGGIYLDTDVEVIKTFTPLLKNKVFMGYEENNFICTAVIGAEPKNNTIKRLFDFYTTEIWNVDFINNPVIFKYLLEHDSESMIDCKLYPKSFFSPYIPSKKYEETVENKQSYSIHWFSSNWNMTLKGYVFINTKHINNPIELKIQQVKKVLGYLKKRISLRG